MTGPRLGILLVLVLLFGCRTGNRPDRPWNLLLVTFDTTRADRIGCYGNERIQTPTLDMLAAEGIRFANAMSTNPITAPSHTSILTGRFPIAHGIRDNGLFKLADEQVTLAEILKEQGYATAAAIGAFPLSSQFGLDQGFDLYQDHITGDYENYQGHRTIPKSRLFFDERKAAEVNESVLPWLADHAAKPFFLWVHYFDPHQPFEPNPPYNHRYADDLYNGEIAYADACLGFLLEYIKGLGALERTLVVMTADHGEGLGDHNELTHAVLAYNSTLHVPLIVRPPLGAAPAGLVVEERVGVVDIVPTILELLDIDWPRGRNDGGDPTPATLQGRSLTPFWKEGGRESRTLYSENLSPALSHGWGELRVWFEGDYKYIHGPNPKLFDLGADPGELDNLVTVHSETAARYKLRLIDFLNRNALAGVSKTEAISAEVMEQLAALGYASAPGEGGELVAEKLKDGGVDPQDRVGDINDMSMAKQLLYQGHFHDAMPFAERLYKADPESPTYQEIYGTALANVGRVQEAWDLLQRMRERGKVTEEFLLWMTRYYFLVGEREKALDVLKNFVEGRPSTRSAWMLATFYDRMGNADERRVFLEKALALDPNYVQARMDLAIYHAEQGDREKAEEEFIRALSDNPFDPRVHYNYGTFLVEGGWHKESMSHFQRAVKLDPGYRKAYLALVALNVAEGARSEAEAAFAVLQRLAPQSEEAQTAASMLAQP